ncbi:MAG: TonB-dependent receptor [Saprospiraceae bacterium]|nr:TonB-dependent receptor [Saprospiraceae bacterium]
MKFGLTLLLCTLISILSITAQEKITISGHVKDIASGEDLIGATVSVNNTSIGVSTNIYGFYSLTLPKGKHIIQVSYIGYTTLTEEYLFDTKKEIDFELKMVSSELAEVLVKADKEDVMMQDAGVGTTKINVKKLETLPVFMGEKDILKSIQLLPGISAVSEGSTGLTIRGGTPAQNLILLDEAPVYNPSHFLGFFSVFNSDALKDLTIYKGGIPAQYGSRASSVLDIYMKNGNNRKFAVSGGLGLISSRLTVEGPIVKNKGSFIASGRLTYLDLIMKAAQPDRFGDLALGFWDVNVKLNYSFGKKDRLYVSGYAGRDNFIFGNFGLSYGNYTATARWNHTFNEKLFANTSFFFSDYYYGYIIGRAGNEFTIEAGIRDFALKQDYSYYLNPKNTIRAGFNSTYHQFQPSQLVSENDNINSLISDKKHAIESGVYISNEMQITDKFKAVYGLRFSLFNQFGPGDLYNFDENNNITDTTTYLPGQHIQTYWGLEPRLALTYDVLPTTKLELGYHRIHQYVHLLTNSTSAAPNDMWIPSTNLVKPQIADQISLGIKQSFLNDRLNISLEGYYKNLQNQVDYENGADILLNAKIESQILNGRGWAYGGELLVQARFGNFNGWISYTLSRTVYQFDEINFGVPYLAKQDKTHDIAIVGTYELKKRWVFSLAWIYQTGNAVTFPSAKYEINGQKVSYFTERNGYRMPASHRLDIAITFRNKITKKFRSSFTIGAYNVYNQYNPYSITFQENETDPSKTDAVQLSLFGIVPTITWNFSF